MQWHSNFNMSLAASSGLTTLAFSSPGSVSHRCHFWSWVEHWRTWLRQTFSQRMWTAALCTLLGTWRSHLSKGGSAGAGKEKFYSRRQWLETLKVGEAGNLSLPMEPQILLLWLWFCNRHRVQGNSKGKEGDVPSGEEGIRVSWALIKSMEEK